MYNMKGTFKFSQNENLEVQKFHISTTQNQRSCQLVF